jgi:hypothetical protein
MRSYAASVCGLTRLVYAALMYAALSYKYVACVLIPEPKKKKGYAAGVGGADPAARGAEGRGPAGGALVWLLVSEALSY